MIRTQEIPKVACDSFVQIHRVINANKNSVILQTMLDGES